MTLFTHEGISLRPVEEADLDWIRQLRNDESTWPSLGDPRPLKRGRQEAWLAGVDASASQHYFVALDDRGTRLGLIRMDEQDLVNRSVRIGLDVVPELRGKGWGFRIYGALLAYVFDYLGVHRVWLLVLATNKPALGLYKKLGFRLEGRQRQAVWRAGAWVDYLSMSILESDYR
jgi:RimJ/RimL family protein N-acetyltransferase